MTQVIIYTNEIGGVTTCYPSGEIPIEAVMEKDIPQNSNARIVEFESLPFENDDFYDAWELINDEIIVNINKAKEITKDRLRIERIPLLQAQDIAFQKALESGSDTSEIVAEKQRLRDITLLADSVTTLEGLRAINA